MSDSTYTLPDTVLAAFNALATAARAALESTTTKDDA